MGCEEEDLAMIMGDCRGDRMEEMFVAVESGGVEPLMRQSMYNTTSFADGRNHLATLLLLPTVHVRTFLLLRAWEVVEDGAAEERVVPPPVMCSGDAGPLPKGEACDEEEETTGKEAPGAPAYWRTGR